MIKSNRNPVLCNSYKTTVSLGQEYYMRSKGDHAFMQQYLEARQQTS